MPILSLNFFEWTFLAISFLISTTSLLDVLPRIASAHNVWISITELS